MARDAAQRRSASYNVYVRLQIILPLLFSLIARMERARLMTSSDACGTSSGTWSTAGWLQSRTKDSERSILLSPPADAFFDQVISLSMTGPDLLEVLRRRRTELPDATLRRIVEQTATPRAALQAARDVLLSPAADDPLAAALWRQECAAMLGRPHSMAMHELETLGGASASDEEFLRRLGWTRARASQVLGELAERNLVTASDEQTPGGGRPRRVFRPADPPLGALGPSGATELPVRDL